MIDTGDRDAIVAGAKNEVFELLKRSIRPEFLNRIDEVVMFEPLGRDEIHQIVKLQIDMVIDRLKENGIELSVSKDAIDWLAQLGYDPQFGARPLKRVLQKRILDELSKQILMGKLSNHGKVHIDLAGAELVFEGND
jgi:ATP-dependent Clp protease ATP-binding subunit ClpB